MTFKIIMMRKNAQHLRGTIIRKTLSFGFMFIAILALGIIFQVNAAQSTSVTIKSYGQIAYVKSASITTETAPPFPWYPIIKELAWWMFGVLSAVGGILKILGHKKRKYEVMH